MATAKHLHDIMECPICTELYTDPRVLKYAFVNLFAQPLQVLFGLPLGLEPSTLYSIHFFTQSVSSFQSMELGDI